MIAYIEIPKESTKSELINEFSEVEGHRFLYTSKEHMDTGIKNTIPLNMP